MQQYLIVLAPTISGSSGSTAPWTGHCHSSTHFIAPPRLTAPPASSREAPHSEQGSGEAVKGFFFFVWRMLVSLLWRFWAFTTAEEPAMPPRIKAVDVSITRHYVR